MNKNTKDTYLVDFRTSLSNLEMSQLRQKASKNFGIKLTRQHTKEDIIDLIIHAVSTSNFAEDAENELQTGCATVKLLPTKEHSSGFPVFINCNGYSIYIPVGIPVNVPIKIIEVLENAEELKKTQNEFGEYVDSFELSYPFQTLATNPGPDPKPGREAQTERKWKPFKDFYKKMGYWPSAKTLQQFSAAALAQKYNNAASEEFEEAE